MNQKSLLVILLFFISCAENKSTSKEEDVATETQIRTAPFDPMKSQFYEKVYIATLH